jgi:hypothetical protein
LRDCFSIKEIATKRAKPIHGEMERSERYEGEVRDGETKPFFLLNSAA